MSCSCTVGWSELVLTSQNGSETGAVRGRVQVRGCVPPLPGPRPVPRVVVQELVLSRTWFWPMANRVLGGAEANCRKLSVAAGTATLLQDVPSPCWNSGLNVPNCGPTTHASVGDSVATPLRLNAGVAGPGTMLQAVAFQCSMNWFLGACRRRHHADGSIVYAMGPALSVRTLAELLHRAGAVRAMELGINTEWVSFMTHDSARDPINPPATKLLPEFRQNGDATSTATNATSSPSTAVSLVRIRRRRKPGRHRSFVC